MLNSLTRFATAALPLVAPDCVALISATTLPMADDDEQIASMQSDWFVPGGLLPFRIRQVGLVRTRDGFTSTTPLLSDRPHFS